MKTYKAIQISLAVFVFALTAGAETLVALPPKDPLVWDALEKNADLPAMTNVAYFTFWVTNISSADAVIFSNETSCDCTVTETASKLPWVIKPGESGWFKMLVNIKGKWGLVTKDATLYTSYGTQMLTVHMDIPLSPAPFNVSSRLTDQMASQKDRQAVFGEHCEVCHSWPGRGRTGEALFQSVCAICHISDHRAQMVPDLAALNHEANADFWRTNIMLGRTNSLMPAFAKAAGGILDTDQIESLVTFLVKKYPSNGAAASAGSGQGTHLNP